jgi:hypothetical protein
MPAKGARKTPFLKPRGADVVSVPCDVMLIF